MNKVAILGGGNGAHAAASDLALRGFAVNFYEDARFVSKMRQVFTTRQIHVKGACEGTAKLALVTTDLAEAIQDVEHIILAVPAFAHADYAEQLAQAVRPGQIILLIPGTFGSLLLWQALKRAGRTDVTVAETHTLPYAARLTGPGEVLIMGRFNPLKLGVMPACRTEETLAALQPYFAGLEATESVVACGLSSLNPIIHVPGCILNAGRIEYAQGEFFFYTEGFTDCVARTTEAVDQERIALLQQLGYAWDIVAHGVGGSVHSDDVREAVAGNADFAKIKGPADTRNRYYTEDIPYGLALWAKLARQLDVQTPLMDALVTIGSAILGQNCWQSGHSLADLGLAGLSQAELSTYLQNG